jgi:hypothetical protein
MQNMKKMCDVQRKAAEKKLDDREISAVLAHGLGSRIRNLADFRSE